MIAELPATVGGAEEKPKPLDQVMEPDDWPSAIEKGVPP